MSFIFALFIRSELASFGRTEDGEDYSAPVYQVVLEAVNGRRWVWSHFFPGCERSSHEGCINFANLSEKAQGDAERTLAKIE